MASSTSSSASDLLLSRAIPVAVAAMEHAAAKHSHYNVGACLVAADGRHFTGVNVESDSYGLCMCGERVALFKALSEGARSFVALAVATRDGGPSCGACRQLLAEYCPLDMVCAFTAGAAGEIRRTMTVGEMLPDPFVLHPSSAAAPAAAIAGEECGGGGGGVGTGDGSADDTAVPLPASAAS